MGFAQRLLLICGFAVLAGPAFADHVDGNLVNFIDDLYGGEGIFLPASTSENIPTNVAEAHVPHFTGPEQIQELSSLSSGILAGSGVYALNSTTIGVSFDLTQGVPVAVEDSLGPLLAERASTVGDGRLSFGFGYSRQKFEELDGVSLDDTTVTFIHQDCCAVGPPPIPPPDGQRTGFENDLIRLDIDIDLEQEVYAFFGNYGISDRWDIGMVVPIVSVEARAFSVATVVDGGTLFAGTDPIHTFESDPSAAFSDTGGSETGLGDVIVRSKYHLFGEGTGDTNVSLLGQVTFPTGEEQDLLGTGETKFRGMVIASRTYGRTTPHINLAYEAATSNGDLENFTYAVGFDTRFSSRFTAAVDVLGRKNPNVHDIGNNVVDLAIAAKYNPFSEQNTPINAFVSFPLNDDGLRADMIWGIGIDVILD